MTDQQQVPLFHEDIFEATRTVIMAMGGAKKVAFMLWPDKPPAQGSELLNNCLNTTRPEKLDPQQVLFLMSEGQRVGCHAIADFMGREAGYKFIPIKPEDEKDELQKKLLSLSADLKQSLGRLEALNLV